MKRFALVLALVALLAACGKGKNDATVLAKVNGTTITVADFRHEVANLPPQYKAMADTVEGQHQILDTMVIRELMLEEAKKEKVDKLPEVEAKLADLKKQLIIGEFLNKRATVTDDELKKVYEENKASFKMGEQVRASHILVATEAEARTILDELKKGADFAALAKGRSIDKSSGIVGGDLGWFSRQNMVPAFANAAFALKEGQLSAPVKSQYGYHLIKLTGRRPAGFVPFEEMKEQIKARLSQQRQPEVFQKLQGELKAKAKITINDDGFKKLAEPTSSK
ncbi:MAG TPA: peptidyl-prolyl cis-trans isomerase [Geobacterales bacterium]|nr:peptidyl-prolyl cis-trans isomerase [Geobacterales bacterium]